MVSIRRRKLLGLCSGRSSFLFQLPKFNENGSMLGSPIRNFKSLDMHRKAPVDISRQNKINISEACPGSSNISGGSSLKEEQDQQTSGKEIKRRKRQRRKHFGDQESCVMRGVYFKNMKWQAAIKVDKKQIHLGTLGSQEAATHLYDRAAFMCGREPNFELSEEEMQELRRLKWDEFLTMTRNAIANKKQQRKLEAGNRKKHGSSMQSSNQDSIHATETEPEASNS